MGEKIKVLVVDDHDMVRMGLVTFLSMEDDIEIVGEASDGQDAIERAKETKPDVILMDLLMEKMNGIEATKVLSKTAAKIIVLTSYLDDEMLFPVMKAGAFSYLLKTSTAEGRRNCPSHSKSSERRTNIPRSGDTKNASPYE